MQIKNNFFKKYLPIFVFQLISVALIVITLVIIKLYFKDNYKGLTDLNDKYVTPHTTFKTHEVESEGEKEVTPVLSENNFVVQTACISGNKFTHPLINGTKTSCFGMRNDPFTTEIKKHKGTDIAAQAGTEILAAAGGTVAFVGYDEYGYGNYLTIAHSKNVKTLYAHCSNILVKQGDTIKEGQVVATVGSTGASTGNHLHFEIRLNGEPVDPEWFINIGE